MKSLYEAVVTSQGGRNGHIRSNDGHIDMKVAIPKEMGGPGGATNPEQLFAAGYAACFESALGFVARGKKVTLQESKIVAHVGIGPAPSGGFMLAVRLEISLPGLDRAVAQSLVDEAHKVCPYSNATRGNIDVQLVLAD